MQIYSMTENDLTKISNQVKESLVQALLGNEIISNENARKVVNEYTIVVTQKGWLGNLWDKFHGIKGEHMAINVLKTCRMGNLEIEETEDVVEENDEN